MSDFGIGRRLQMAAVLGALLGERGAEAMISRDIPPVVPRRGSDPARLAAAEARRARKNAKRLRDMKRG